MRLALIAVVALAFAGTLLLADTSFAPTETARADCAPNEFGEDPACVPYCTPRVSGMRVCYPWNVFHP